MKTITDEQAIALIDWNRELFNKTCEYFDELIKLKDVIATLKYENEMLKEQLNINKEG